MIKSSVNDILKYMPLNLSHLLAKLPETIKADIEEIRLRIGRPLIILGADKEIFVDSKGGITEGNNDAYIITSEDIKAAVQLITNFSLYSVEDELRNGYVTINGGHRVGICGRAVLDSKSVRTIKDISFINYRVAKQIIGAGDIALDYIIRYSNMIYNTLIISPPQCGKTTLLRDIVRQLSNGSISRGYKGFKIGLVDERNEIAACSFGKPRNDIGLRTDVFDGCPKADGIIMMIRSMSPDIIATDEIGRKEDAEAILDAINAGVKVITTIHGSDIEDFLKRVSLESVRKDLFERIIVMSRRKGVGTLEKVYDENYNEIFTQI